MTTATDQTDTQAGDDVNKAEMRTLIDMNFNVTFMTASQRAVPVVADQGRDGEAD